jgi:hypothetical protein
VFHLLGQAIGYPVNILEWRHMITSACYYVEMLKKLKEINCKEMQRKNRQFLFPHNNARLYIGIQTKGDHCKFRWTVLLHQLYSPDLVPSDFHLFGQIKADLHWKHLANDDTVIMAIKRWLLEVDSNFCKSFSFSKG